MDKDSNVFVEGLFLLLEILLFLFVLLCLLGGYFIFVHHHIFDIELTELNLSELIIDKPIELLLINYIPTTFAILFVLLLMHVFVFKRDESLLGFRKKGLIPEFSYGILLASVLIFGGFFLLWASDQIDIFAYNWNGQLIAGFLLLFTVQSFQEEVLFRSYLIPTIENRLGTWTALILSSLGFMSIHFLNAGISIMGCINLAIGGFVMGLLFIIYRNVWAPSGFHMAWNYLQSTILGFEVSGNKTYSWLLLNDKGSDFFTGGEFGYEGSIFSILFLLLSIMYLWKRHPNLTDDFIPLRKKAPEIEIP